MMHSVNDFYVLSFAFTENSMVFPFGIFQDDGVEENGHHLPILETPTPPDGYIPQSSSVVPVSENLFHCHCRVGGNPQFRPKNICQFDENPYRNEN